MTEKEVSELVEKLKSGCPLLPYRHGTNPYNVAKADRLMTAAASLIERQQKKIQALTDAARGAYQFVERQQAEIENLKHDIGRSIATNTELLAEIERKDEALREARAAIQDACHAAAIYGDDPPVIYQTALLAVNAALASPTEEPK